jgi:hypothetical protein
VKDERALVWALWAAAAILRLHGAWSAQPLTGFDGPYHAAYIGILHLEHRWPLPGESWSTFHPPLYYALSALLWGLLPEQLPARGVLFALRGLNVAAGLALGLAAWRAARLLFPERPAVALCALALALFLPMLVPLSFLVGNQILAASLASWGVLLLLRALAKPGSARLALAAGAVLGLAVLTRLDALAVAGGAGLALLLAGLRREGPRLRALAPAALLGLAALLASGAYFARNFALTGSPLVLEVPVSADLMRTQGYGSARPLASYLSLDPAILWNPADRSPRAEGAVWPATFAGIWFDLHGTVVRVVSPLATGFARGLFALGAAFTALAVAGAWALFSGRVQCAVPGAPAALALLAASGLASYVFFTAKVATFSTLKGTLLAPSALPFLLVASVGLDLLARAGRRAAALAVALVVALVLATSAILWVGWLAPNYVSAAVYYVRVYNDAPTQRVYDYFVRGRPLRIPQPGARPAPPAPPPRR